MAAYLWCFMGFGEALAVLGAARRTTTLGLEGIGSTSASHSTGEYTNQISPDDPEAASFISSLYTTQGVGSMFHGSFSNVMALGGELTRTELLALVENELDDFFGSNSGKE
ncbi:hypothetical protein B0I37DRAFT_351282 [Chaetomium sp. MPI-CAGE-AT-0009]|nr:hypothetical protein B0I37DRAFT_351282 [Chaetomium sp. MPI-CAGE-AT-0009]